MTKFKLLHLKNEMLAANFLANLIGVFFANTTLYFAEGFPIWHHSMPYWIDTLFNTLAFSFVWVMTLLYEKPIRRYRYHRIFPAGTYFTKKTCASFFPRGGPHHRTPDVAYPNPNSPGGAPVRLQPDSAHIHHVDAAQDHQYPAKFEHSDTAIAFRHICQRQYFFRCRHFSNHPAFQESIDSL